jgi:hypothetical protein
MSVTNAILMPQKIVSQVTKIDSHVTNMNIIPNFHQDPYRDDWQEIIKVVSVITPQTREQ